MKNSVESVENAAEKKERRNIKVMDLILVIGVMGWIKTTKDRNRERKWEQEDKQEAKAEAAELPPGDMPGA